jgi:crotonobetainyl-CoA:carnitine CoA-transferase CaiB-like acyl-CoA transferase
MLTTMLNTVAHAISEDMIEYEGRAAAPIADKGLYGLSARYRLYETAEGWVFLAAPTQREFGELTAALAPYGDLGDGADDDALAETLSTIFKSRPASDWERELTAQDVACVEVAETSPEAAMMEGEDCLGRTMGILVDLEHPVIGEYPRLTPLAAMSRSAGVTGGAPLLGEHTNAVLAELGYTPEQVDDLRSRGTVGG